VFEYRAGDVLQRGVLYPHGLFVSDEGTKPIPLKEYHPGKDLPIYNLPGNFIRMK
jgi:hypothetical protein